MKIKNSQIKHKEVVGTTEAGKPVLMIETYGGLFAFFTKNDNDEVETVATSAHKAIGAWMAEKKSPGLQWVDGFLKSERDSSHRFDVLRKALFVPVVPADLSKNLGNSSGIRSDDLYIVYNVSDSVIAVMDADTVRDGIKSEDIGRDCLIRCSDLSEPVMRLEYHKLYKNHYEYRFHSQEHLRDYLTRGRFSIMSAYRHDKTDEENRSNHENLRQDIISHGFLYTPVQGSWGGHKEPSFIIHRPGFMIHEPKIDIIRKLATKYNQTAHIHGNLGKFKEISNDPAYQPPPGGKGHEIGDFDDNYSIIDLVDGSKAKFRLDLGYGAVAKSEKALKLIHFSENPDLTVIDPMHMGSGIKGEEIKHGVPDVRRSYYYRSNTPPEALIANQALARYDVELQSHQRLYDLGTDEENIVIDAIKANDNIVNTDNVLNAVKSAGYHGFYNSQSRLPGAVALFYPQKVTRVIKLRS